MDDRIEKTDTRLPLLVWRIINSPKITLGMGLCVASVASFVSFHLALLIISFLYILVAYYIEKRNVDAFILPPLVVFAVANFFGGSLGPFLLAEDVFSMELDAILITHSVFAATFFALILVYWWINRNNPPIVILEDGALPKLFKGSRFRFISIVILLFAIGFEYVMISSGVADRGRAGDIILETRYGFWSYFVAFAKLEYIAFVLLPYLYLSNRGIGKAFLVILIFVHALFQLANTNRGGLVFPFIFMVFGYWMIGGAFKRVFLSFVFLTFAIFFLTPVLGAFRGSGAIETTDLKDVGSRIRLLVEDRGEFWGGGSVFSGAGTVIGRAMLGANDPLIYSDTPGIIPFAGWERIDDVMYLWMPSMFFPEKPSLLDGDYIRELYTGVRNERSSITISYQADLYRRFGWLGVFLGYPVYALLISLFVRYGVRSAARPSTRLWGIMILLFITTFIHGVPFGSLLTMIWNFFYDYPKYLIILWTLVFVSKIIFRESPSGTILQAQ